MLGVDGLGAATLADLFLFVLDGGEEFTMRWVFFSKSGDLALTAVFRTEADTR